MNVNDHPLSHVDEAKRSISLAIDYSTSIAKQDGHWVGEIFSNATLTAEHVFFHQILGNSIPDASAYQDYLLSQQQ